MTEERPPRIERLLDLTARKVSGSGLHPIEILQHVRDAVEATAREGMIANDITLSFHESDYRRYEPSLVNLRFEIERLLDGIERSKGYGRIGGWVIRFESSLAAAEGSPIVRASFSDTSHRASATRLGPTAQITRLRGHYLVLGDGTRIRLSHVPFSIGRGPGNDLVTASLAVSRRHAEIVPGPGGLVLRDRGSRNGLVVDGRRLSEVLLAPGVTVTLGDVTLQLEVGE